MFYKFVTIPATNSEIFERNFHGRNSVVDSIPNRVFSVGISWTYPTEIKGWLDWDFPNRERGLYRKVAVYEKRFSDRLVTIVRNPFSLFFEYFRSNWAHCRKHHNISTDGFSKQDFHRFVDLYLDRSESFHVPAYKKSLFSALKTKDGKWLLDSNSIVLRYETLDKDMEYFSKKVNIPIQEKVVVNDSDLWKEFYRSDQIEELSKLWHDDLQRFNYSFDKTININNKSFSNLKVAVCFSGHIRDLDTNSEFWKKLINETNADVYASFWDEENPEVGDTLDNFKKTYSYKNIEVESFSSFKKSTIDLLSPLITPPTSLKPYLQKSTKQLGTLSMWYKIWKANMLSKSLDIDYDIVIRARTDSHFPKNISIFDNQMLNVPIGMNKTHMWKDSEGFNDIFAFGPPKIMDYYSLCYLFMMEHIGKNHYMVPPEHFLHTHMNKVSIPVRFIPNHIVITRKSKGKEDEVYNGWVGDDLEELIVKSDFMELNPNNKFIWAKPISHIFE